MLRCKAARPATAVLLALLLSSLPTTTLAGGCVVGQWKECRQNLTQAIFGQATVPNRLPDHIFPGGGPQVSPTGTEYTMSGLPGPGAGTGVGAVSWSNNLTALVWTMTGPFFSLNTTVFYSLNTSSRAPANYNPPPYAKGQGPGIPGPDDPWGQSDGYYPRSIGDTLVLYHNGHETATCTPNYDGISLVLLAAPSAANRNPPPLRTIT